MNIVDVIGIIVVIVGATLALVYITLSGAPASIADPPSAPPPAGAPSLSQDRRDALACNLYRTAGDVLVLALKVIVVGLVLPIALSAGCEAKKLIRGDAVPVPAFVAK